MGWRSELEDKYTVLCQNCKEPHLDTTKKPNQKYLIGKPCTKCGYELRRKS